MRAAVCITSLFAFTAVAAGPRLSPPFEILRTGKEKPLSLSAYRGKIVALAFISTTCPHCQALTTELVAMAGQYQPSGVQFLECAVNPSAEADVPGFVAQFRPPFPVGYSNQAAVNVYLGMAPDDPRIFWVPHLVFIDRSGRIQGDFPGESDFIKDAAANTRLELDKLLKVEAPSSANGTFKSAGASAAPSHP